MTPWAGGERAEAFEQCDELGFGLFPWPAVGNSPGAAAAEDDEFPAGFFQAAEGDVRPGEDEVMVGVRPDAVQVGGADEAVAGEKGQRRGGEFLEVFLELGSGWSGTRNFPTLSVRNSAPAALSAAALSSGAAMPMAVKSFLAEASPRTAVA